ncbi:MAG: TM0106 family RecB-like putative nuclease [Candidatus Heimdallarchaeaceae archaeon]
MLISHYDIRNYYKCPMLLYLNNFGPENERRVHPIIKQRKKRAYKIELDEILIEQKVDETLTKMKEGKKSIYQAWIKFDKYVARVYKLIKVPGKSSFGNYSYVSEFSGNRKHIRKPLIMEGTFQSYLCKNSFNSESDYFIVQKNNEKLELSSIENLPQLLNDFPEIENILLKKKTITPNYTRDCKICEWREYCKTYVKNTSDLTLISGIGKTIKTKLLEMGIHDVHSLASLDVSKLPKTLYEKGDFEYFKLQAQSIIKNTPIIREPVSFPESKIELFVDVEGSPYHNFVWVIGCYKREKNELEYIPFLAKKPSEEKKMMEEFLDFVSSLEGYTLYHWSLAEPKYFRNLAQKYNLNINKVESLLKNAFDLFLCFKDKIILPLTSYTLKDVAKWLGFEWFDPLSDGATSILLFDKWYLHKDRKALEQAISYNSDDCKAMIIVKDYLSKISSR